MLETSAAIAAISLRAGIEFLRAAPAAQILQPAELRSWGEMGRRLAMTDYESAARFCGRRRTLRNVSPELRPDLSLVYTTDGPFNRHRSRNSSLIPAFSAEIDDDELLRFDTRHRHRDRAPIGKTQRRVSQCQRHVSRDSMNRFNDANVTTAALALAGAFASRAGGIAADAWAIIPEALAELSASNAKRLLKSAQRLSRTRRRRCSSHPDRRRRDPARAPEIFDEWIELLWVVAAHGNASLVAFVRSSPGFIRLLNADPNRAAAIELSRRVLSLTKEIAAIDGEAALACFRSSSRALRSVSIEQFEAWARRGLVFGSLRHARASQLFLARNAREL